MKLEHPLRSQSAACVTEMEEGPCWSGTVSETISPRPLLGVPGRSEPCRV